MKRGSIYPLRLRKDRMKSEREVEEFILHPNRLKELGQSVLYKTDAKDEEHIH